MRLTFISTLSGASWEGSEELWSLVALLALEQQHQVQVVVYKWENIPSRISQLQEKGAEIVFRERKQAFVLKPFLQRQFDKVTNYL